MIHGYVYKITNKQTGEFYIGSRWHNKRYNRTPSDDFMNYYFSSGQLKENIRMYPELFDGSIIFEFGEDDVVYWYEQLLIRENITNPLCKNRHFIDPDNNDKVFRSKEWTEERKNKLRKPKPVGFSDKLRVANLGKQHTEYTKQKIREYNLGKTQTIETKLKRVETMKRLKWVNNGLLNKRVSEAEYNTLKQNGWINGRIGKSNQYMDV